MMSPEINSSENFYYITKTCYVIPDRHVLVNNGAESEELAALSWRLLNHFMKSPYCTFTHDELIDVLYEDDFNRSSSNIALAMTRLRQYFKDIGVDKAAIDRAFQTLYWERKHDMEKAFSFFSRSIDLVPDGYAFNKLGCFYEKGYGCEPNPSKACECFMRGVDDVLEDDVTGWNLFNAGRVCANRITGQPECYFDLPRAFILFEDALKTLPVEDHDQILLEMLDILLYGDTSAITPETLSRKKDETKSWANRYLSKAMDNPAMQKNYKTDRIRVLIKEL